MQINVDEQDGVVFVSLTGRLDASTSSDLTPHLEHVVSDGVKILFGLEKVDYVSSAGLRVLLVMAKKIRAANGKMCLTGLNENVKEVFDVSGFTSILDVCDDRTEALGLLNE